MKIRCEADNLAAALRFIRRVRPTSRRWNSLWIRAKEPDEVELIAQAVDVLARAAFRAEVLDEGHAYIPRRVFWSLVIAQPKGPLEIQDDRRSVMIEGPSTRLMMKHHGVEDPPKSADTNYSSFPGTASILATDLSSAIHQVIGTVAKDETRGLLTGVSWRIENGVATLSASDSYRAAMCKLEVMAYAPDANSFVVPSNSMRDLDRGAKNAAADRVRLIASENRVVFVLSEPGDPNWRTVETWPMEGEFPDYAGLVPNKPAVAADVSRRTLLAVLDRIRTFSDRFALVMGFGEELLFRVENPEEGFIEERLPADIAGSAAWIGFNPRFLYEGVAAVTGSRVLLEVTDESTPAVVRSPEDSDFVYLLMPVRLQGD